MANEKKGPFMAIVLAVIAGGLIPATFGFLTKVYEIKNKEPEAVSNLTSAAQIYDSLFLLKEKVGAAKIILLRAHDTGGPIPNKSTVVAEVFNEPLKGSFANWQSQPLDIHYIKILEDLVAQKRIVLNKDDIEQGILKNSYGAEKIIISDMRYIGANKDSIYYISILFTESYSESDEYQDFVRSEVEKIRRILSSATAIK
jgi:hypothetical protein